MACDAHALRETNISMIYVKDDHTPYHIVMQMLTPLSYLYPLIPVVSGINCGGGAFERRQNMVLQSCRARPQSVVRLGYASNWMRAAKQERNEHRRSEELATQPAKEAQVMASSPGRAYA
jgi:hypothetical protein